MVQAKKKKKNGHPRVQFTFGQLQAQVFQKKLIINTVLTSLRFLSPTAALNFTEAGMFFFIKLVKSLFQKP